MKRFFSLFLILFVFMPALVLADPSSQALSDANSTATAARELVVQAERTLQGHPGRTELELALRLYIKAGEMFEKSYKIYATLGPSYVNPQDIEGARAAMQNCINSISEIKKHL